MSDQVFSIAPHKIRFKLAHSLPLEGDWDLDRRVKVADTAKYRSIMMHYRDGVPWLKTPIFTEHYAIRFSLGASNIRNCSSLKQLAKYYDKEVSALYASMKRYGFLTHFEGEEVAFPHCYIARDGEVMLGNNGNHRRAIAELLGLDRFYFTIAGRHPQAPPTEFEMVNVPEKQPTPPILTMAQLNIPAMTTLDERRCYYHCSRKMADKGAIVEFGTWLGASTAFIAAGLRDAGVDKQMYAYDRFEWGGPNAFKELGANTRRAMIDEFVSNLGDLKSYVKPEAVELRDLVWRGGAISYAAFDGPKRRRDISYALSELGTRIIRGGLISWQDFAYFPSYDIPACLDILEEGGFLRFEEAVYPGTTVVVSVVNCLPPDAVTEQALDFSRWDADRIQRCWNRWQARIPAQGRARFMVGAAWFLLDRGFRNQAKGVMQYCLDNDHDGAVKKKFEYLRKHRATVVSKYRPLFDQCPKP